MSDRSTPLNTASLPIPSFFEEASLREGDAGASVLPRLAAEAVGAIELHWRAQGARVKRQILPVYADRPQLTLEIEGTIAVPCQRCLAPVEVAVQLARTYVVFDTDAQADEALLDDDRFDAIAAIEHVDVLPLIEDEVLLQLEDAALHTHCPAEALAALGLSDVGDRVVHTERPESPFAALAGLKKG